MAFQWPLKTSVMKPGEKELVGHDILGNEIWEWGDPKEIPVFSASIVRAEDGQSGSYFYVVEYLEVIAPIGALEDIEYILRDGEKWYRDKAAQDYTDNSMWNPGLVTHYFKRTK